MAELTLFGYRPGHSLLHRLDARFKILFFLLMSISGSFAHGQALAVLTVAAAGLMINSRLSLIAAARERGRAALRAALEVARPPAPRDDAATVVPKLCSFCGLCVIHCPYGARFLDEESRHARVIESLCQGCGACATVYRHEGDYRLKVGLACQTVVEPGMYLTQLPFYPSTRAVYDIERMGMHGADRLIAAAERGVTVFVTTHYMDEAESICDEIVIMNAGKIIERGAPQDLVRRHIGRFTLEVPVNGGDAEGAIVATETNGVGPGTALREWTQGVDQDLGPLF